MRSIRSVSAAWSLGIALVLLLAPGGSAQAQTAHYEAPRVAPVPFGPGEKAVYEVRLGLFGEVGTGAMEVVGVEQVNGAPTYHLRFDLEGGVLFAKVDDRLQSWLDVAGIFSRRFEQDQKEVTYERHRIYDFFPAEGIWKRENGESGALHTDRPLDDVSFVYFVRTIPLEVGETYTFNRYFKEDGNPVVVKVLRRDTITVPAGTFNTIVVRPIIQTDGLFGEGGEAEIHFTDDRQRILVMMKSKVPVIGTLDLYLSSYTPGRRLSPVMLKSSGPGG